MQPVQLSLIPRPTPAPPDTPIAEVPEPQIAAATALLADLIAKAAYPARRGDDDE